MYFTHCSSVSTVNFEQVNAGWAETFRTLLNINDEAFLQKKLISMASLLKAMSQKTPNDHMLLRTVTSARKEMFKVSIKGTWEKNEKNKVTRKKSEVTVF